MSLAYIYSWEETVLYINLQCHFDQNTTSLVIFIFTAEETEAWSVNSHQVHQSRTRGFISPPVPHYWTLTWLTVFVEGEKGGEEEMSL